jgi:hypothetical protein
MFAIFVGIMFVFGAVRSILFGGPRWYRGPGPRWYGRRYGWLDDWDDWHDPWFADRRRRTWAAPVPLPPRLPPRSPLDQKAFTLAPVSIEQALDQLVIAIVARTNATPDQEREIREVMFRLVQGGAIRDARDAIVEAMVEIREILDPEQRQLLTPTGLR